MRGLNGAPAAGIAAIGPRGETGRTLAAANGSQGIQQGRRAGVNGSREARRSLLSGRPVRDLQQAGLADTLADLRGHHRANSAPEVPAHPSSGRRSRGNLISLATNRASRSRSLVLAALRDAKISRSRDRMGRRAGHLAGRADLRRLDQGRAVRDRAGRDRVSGHREDRPGRPANRAGSKPFVLRIGRGSHLAAKQIGDRGRPATGFRPSDNQSGGDRPSRPAGRTGGKPFIAADRSRKPFSGPSRSGPDRPFADRPTSDRPRPSGSGT